MKEVFGLLNNDAYRNIELIKSTAQQVWENDCKFGELKEINSPYPEFVWILQLYGKFDVKLNYDRSTLHIEVPTKEGFEPLIGYTEESVFRGFDGMIPENLLHNFQVLDRLIQTYKAN